MKYKAEIKVSGDAEAIYKSFEPEIKEQDRSRFTIEKQEHGVLFVIEAADSVALRATLNTITKLLSVYESLGGENEKGN